MRLLLATFAALLMVTNSASAMSGTSQIAWRGKPVAAQPDWPEGVLDLVNDPLRTDGWEPWFSECPNDVHFYAFEAGDTNDVNHLIAKLAAIRAPYLKVLLSPASEPRALGFSTVLHEGNGAAAVFSLGSQKRMNGWYQHLPEVEPGVRKFGVHRYHEPPKAQPPTLTVYVGNEAIDLKCLKIPPAVEVSAVIFAADRAEGRRADLIKAIDDFVAQHQPKSSPPANKQSAKQ